MKDYFIWNGVDCRTYGIHVSEQPPITLPAERSTQTNVPGRPGSLTTLEGDDVYDDLLLTATCFITDTGHYKARIANQIPFEKILRGNPHCSFSVNFRCYPFWYQDDVEDVTATAPATVLNNPGSVYAEPVLTVYGDGDITLMIGQQIVELEGISGSIVIDSVLKEAYKDSDLQNDRMSGEFPVLLPGGNAISWTGDVSRIVVTPNWRYL